MIAASYKNFPPDLVHQVLALAMKPINNHTFRHKGRACMKDQSMYNVFKRKAIYSIAQKPY